MASPPESEPIFTSVYCALSWSSSGTVGRSCATSRQGVIPTTIKAAPGRPSRFSAALRASSGESLIGILLRTRLSAGDPKDFRAARSAPPPPRTRDAKRRSQVALRRPLPNPNFVYCVVVLTASPVLKPVPETTEHTEEISSTSVIFTTPIDGAHAAQDLPGSGVLDFSAYPFHAELVADLHARFGADIQDRPVRRPPPLPVLPP